MYRLIVFQFAILLLLSCKRKKEHTETSNDSTENLKSTDTEKSISEEIFIDSTSFGKRQKFKVLAKKVVQPDSNYVRVSIYKKRENFWGLLFDSIYAADRFTNMLNPRIVDCNKDGFKDFIFKTHTPARGSNEIVKMILFQPKTDSILEIKNSEAYPNLIYNKELDCLDAQMFAGCSTQAYAEIKGDSLVTFASISYSTTNNQMSVYKYDEKGKEEIVYDLDTVNCYNRYKSLNPLVLYTEKEREDWSLLYGQN